MFNTSIDADRLDVFIARCEHANAAQEEEILNEAFDILSWRVKRSAGRLQQNPDWITFSKLISLGGSVSAALMLVPTKHKTTVRDSTNGDIIAKIIPEIDLTRERPWDDGFISHGKTWALALCVAACKAHFYMLNEAKLSRYKKEYA